MDRSCVSGFDPANFKIGDKKGIINKSTKITKNTTMYIAVIRVRLASVLLPSPCLLATKADTAAFIAKKNDRAINLG